MKKLFKISIGIAAYNSQNNIKELLYSLIHQNRFETLIDELILHSDASTDDTLSIARKIKHKKIKIVSSSERKGFARSLQTIINHNKSGYLILLNDDFKIVDPNFLVKLISPLQNEKVDLLTGNPQPLPARNFIEKAGILSFRIFERMRNSMPNPHNKFTCDGKIMVLSKRFMRSLKFPGNVTEMGNVDAYFYFFCLSKNYIYRHNRKAQVLYRYPSTIADYLKWQSRNNVNSILLRSRFGKELVNKEYKIPKNYFSYLTFKEILLNVDSLIFLIIVHFYVNYKKKSARNWFNPRWETIKTSKDLTL